MTAWQPPSICPGRFPVQLRPRERVPQCQGAALQASGAFSTVQVGPRSQRVGFGRPPRLLTDPGVRSRHGPRHGPPAGAQGALAGRSRA